MQSSDLPPWPAAPTPPPLPPPAVPPPQRQGLSGCALAAIIVAAALFCIALIGVAAAILIPNLGALNESAKAAKARRDAKAPQAQPAQPKFLPLTPPQQKALEAFGEALAGAINAKDAERVAQMQDVEALADRAFAGLGGFSDIAKARRRFIAETCEGPDGWLTGLGSGEGKVKFLRTREWLAHPAVLLRVKSGDGGVGYMEVMVRPDGSSFKAVDMFNHLFAATVSQEKRQELAMQTGEGSNLAAAFDVPMADETALVRLQILYAAFNRSQMEDVVRIGDRLPADLKNKMPFFLPRLLALIDLGADDSGKKIDPEYKAALEIAPQVLGQGNIIDLIRANLLILDEDYERARDCLTRVEAILGGHDSHLRLLRAEICYLTGDPAGALALADEASRLEPGLIDAAATRLAVHLDRRDHAAAVREMRQFSDAPSSRKSAEKRKWQELLDSPEFKAWEKEMETLPERDSGNDAGAAK